MKSHWDKSFFQKYIREDIDPKGRNLNKRS